MKIPKPPRYQYIGFFSSMPFIAFTLAYIMYGERLWQEPWVLAVSFPIIFFMGYLSWRAHSVYAHAVRKRFPSEHQTKKRILLLLPVNLLIMTPSVFLIFYVFHWLHLFGYTVDAADLTYGILVGLIVNIVFESLWELMYIMERYKESAAEKEMMEMLHLEQEFNNLKQKVNPHFLFNSFNTLSSLISEDEERAEKFLDELSKVYRYLLRNNEKGMSTVDEETKFILSYSKLLETRYGDGFNLEMEIHPDAKEKLIPSLCLQLLVENAVKHNVVSRHNPIRIVIKTTDDGYLSVENNLNKKTRTSIESTGIGLVNIREKYRLLNHADVSVTESGEHFRVAIPLID
jgi:two-component system LytT family sensor kinase